MKRILIIVTIVLVASAFTVLVSDNWKVKENYSIKVFRNEQVEYPILFKGLKASISFDEQEPENSKISASIDATTIITANESMTAHAKEPSVLDTDKFPLITFESTSVKKTPTGYEATGHLTLKGITKEIKLPFVFEKDTFNGIFTITTKDFDITRKGASPSGQIRIELTIPVTK